MPRPRPFADDDTIVLGAAVSQTGKFSVSGIHTQNGYDFAVDKINSMGGVKVGDKTYKLQIKYYDDESGGDARSAETGGSGWSIRRHQVHPRAWLADHRRHGAGWSRS